MRSKLFLFSFLILSGLLYGNLAYAVSQNSISISISPSNPTPHENVDFTLSSFGSNLDTVLIVWSINGKNTLAGIGKKNFSVTAPGAGEEMLVSARISLPDGEIQKTVTLRPSVMVLLFEATDSFVPPFYKGKALPTDESDIKIVPMPEIKTNAGVIGARNLAYSWQKDFNNDQNASGYGKNYYLYQQDYLDDTSTISVTASTVDQNYSSRASITVSAVKPKISFYKRDSELGTLWENVLPDDYFVNNDEIIEAVPYYISPAEIRYPALVFKWYINGDMITQDAFYKNILPISTKGSNAGTSTIKLEIDNIYKIYQTTTKTLRLTF